ncbi:MAG: phosphatidate cytidylyltransferase, partial [Gammaproteobacteria bacterium]|nr:phosphatidate cytidylyltransferase [Gammaproteobacteria bacterium]
APRQARLGFVLLVAVLSVSARAFLADTAAFTLLMELSVGWWVIALLWLLFLPQRAGAAAVAVAGICALVPAWVALTRMVELWPRGAQWALFALALAFAADTGAYFVGSACGRVKLAPRVSPGKTWEGVVGGMLFALFVALAGSRWFGLAPQRFLPLCLAAAAFSVVGDLTESMFKRASGLKDSGRLFPGHGGVLDRIDSVLACMPVICLGLLWLGVAR